ncbi:MAG: hypothetical protein WD894_19825 [Pirellulales bacterium]
MLVVLDSTPNPKLAELVVAFQRHGGETYLGNAAWQHLESLAGANMAMFLEKYVRSPLDELLKDGTIELPVFTARAKGEHITLVLGEEEFVIQRHSPSVSEEVLEDQFPDDIADQLPG